MSKRLTKQRLISFLISFAMIPLAVFSSLSWAQSKAPRTPIQYAQNSDKARAADVARSAHGGKVLTVDEVVQNGRTVYRVKLLLDGGRIKIVTVDSSGKMI